MSDKSLSNAIENNIGSVLSALLLAFIIGTFAMINSNNKTSLVFATQLEYIAASLVDVKAEIKALKLEMKVNTRDRFTRTDQSDYSNRIENKLEKIEERLLRMEVKGKNL